MPGSSLWLLPPVDHPLNKVLSQLISTHLPAKFPEVTGPSFAPHMTLTSNISPATYGDNPQEWLDSISWPAGETIRVRFRSLASEDVFVRRGFIKVDFDGVRGVAAIARARGVAGEDTVGAATEKWLEEGKSAFGPHVSLIYGNVPIDDTKLNEITEYIKEKGIRFDSDESNSGDSAGWEGGVVWLVPTDRPIGEWKPIATKQL